MNLAFLGDALDHWKGSLFESLHKSGVLRNFAVDPMASDWAAWQPEDVSLFALLLRVDESKIVRHKVGLSNRKHYFDEIEHTGDLFLDPDTGIATGKVKRINQHVKPLEIERLLRGSERLLAVYRHVRAQSVFDTRRRGMQNPVRRNRLLPLVFVRVRHGRDAVLVSVAPPDGGSGDTFRKRSRQTCSGAGSSVEQRGVYSKHVAGLRRS